MSVLRDVAEEVNVHERTLRRGLSQGLIRGRRPMPRQVDLARGEVGYLRAHWPLLSALRQALRTERNVRLAVLVGSAARGALTDRSDVDLVVGLRDPGWSGQDELCARLERAVGRPIDLIDLEAATSDPLLHHAVLDEGRVLIDRDRSWPAMLNERARVARRAATAERALRREMRSLLAELSDQA